MKLSELIQESIKNAMKSGQKTRLSALRGIKAEMTVALTAPGAPAELSDEDIVKIIRKMVKQREDSIEQYIKGGRTDLADTEAGEKEVLLEFLPKDLTLEEVNTIIKNVVTEIGATGMKDMGKVMKIANEEIAGRFDGKQVAGIVKNILLEK